ncbi:MAG: hypothetical protein PHE25_04460 [Candidatus Gracilibacteria bacterium]|nr:hypothetical protein [Candidatus Gracilibacteria bacterium]
MRYYSYFAIGARSTENQYHREVASGLDFPVGMKNPTSGDLAIMINSILASQNPSVYVIGNDVFETTGNKFAHGILRGGSAGPNYSLENIVKCYELMKAKNLNTGIIIDTNHDNSRKKFELQQSIMEEVIENIGNNENLKDFVKGFMVESYLYDGRQDFSENVKYGLSLTDPCIGLEKTRKFVERLYELV